MEKIPILLAKEKESPGYIYEAGRKFGMHQMERIIRRINIWQPDYRFVCFDEEELKAELNRTATKPKTKW